MMQSQRVPGFQPYGGYAGPPMSAGPLLAPGSASPGQGSLSDEKQNLSNGDSRDLQVVANNYSKNRTDIPVRYRSPTLLMIGSVFGIMGFVVAFVLGVIEFFTAKTNDFGQEFASGYGYWPSTVSEMVHNWNSPEGRIFFGFCLIASLLIFQSWYPYELRNVYTGPETIVIFGRPLMYWITFRQVIPVVGLLQLICVSTVPPDQAHGVDYGSVAVHLMGAFMMFIGYMVAELKCLRVCGFSSDFEEDYLDIETEERVVRIVLMWVVTVFYVAFCAFQGYMIADDVLQLDTCCKDEYFKPTFNMTTASGAVYTYSEKTIVVNTASGAWLFVKFASFMTEVVAGLAIIFSHLVLWYYCEERKVDFATSQLREVYNEEEQRSVDFEDLSD
eukprot:TRINITY_DN54207_c0_g1_i1.p2 TRINITY_DN54207_c0_g1~~TRINITY_DN54207_c0_g1_i1.p2  ORF type:complete len:399 (+),score=68.21 TRINITY_DN54207_c0_g1_i1:38-1198(+)